MMTDKETTLQELRDIVRKFQDERDWKKHHTPKNLAISVCIEAAELLEHFQWDRYNKDDKAAIAAEMADVLGYMLHLANALDIDVSSSFVKKMKAAEEKYPVSLFNKNTDNKDVYHRIKQEYRKGRQ